MEVLNDHIHHGTSLKAKKNHVYTPLYGMEHRLDSTSYNYTHDETSYSFVDLFF